MTSKRWISHIYIWESLKCEPLYHFFLIFHYFIYFNCEKLCERSLMAMLLVDREKTIVRKLFSCLILVFWSLFLIYMGQFCYMKNYLRLFKLLMDYRRWMKEIYQYMYKSWCLFWIYLIVIWLKSSFHWSHNILIFI